MKVAIIGGNGQLGTDLVRSFSQQGHEAIPLTHADVQIESKDSVTQCLGALRPALVVNTAAMHNVEKCEMDPELAYKVNEGGAQNLASVTEDIRATLVHFSTDYVFDGSKGRPYVEDDPAFPVNCYGRTKLAGEHAIACSLKRHFILRTSALYGKHPCRAKGGQNFVLLMLRLGRERGMVRVVTDEIIAPTSTSELADQVVVLSHSDAYGTYHATAEGSCSWHEFARTIFVLAGMNVDVQPAHASEFPTKVPRPKYSVLENARLKTLGLNAFLPWQCGLERYLACARATKA